MDGHSIYRIIEFMKFTTYLIFIFISIQIFFLWKDIDKSKVEIESFFSDAFFKKSSIYVFLFSTFSITHEFIEEINYSYFYIYFKILELLALISVVLFSHGWYCVLKPWAKKKAIPQLLLDFK